MTTKPSTTADAVIKALREAAAKNGVTGFIVGFDQAGLLTTHFEAMQMNMASRAINSLFIQFCKMEASSQAVPAEYRALMVELERDFIGLIATFNQKLEKARARVEKKTRTV